MSANAGWVAVDMDGTLCEYDGWHGITHFGKPILPMVEYVKELLAKGVDVRIFTARCQEGEEAITAIELWCRVHLGQPLLVTDRKDMNMVLMIDDRSVNPVLMKLPKVASLVEDTATHWSSAKAPPMEFKR